MATVKYVTSAAFRNSFVDEKGLPVNDGYLYSWEDACHTCPKPLYKSNLIVHPAQTPVAYPNPIRLDAGGSIPPPGVIFFADDKQYFLELKKSDDFTVVQTEEKWPPEIVGPTPPTDELDVTNFIANSDFTEQLRAEFLTADLTATPIKIAPPEWYYVRSNTTATTKITFEKLLLGQTDVPDNPYAQIHYQCTGAGGGETSSDIYHTIKDVRSFEGKNISVGFNGYTPSNGTVTLILRQDFGVSGSGAVDTNVGTITLTGNRKEYTFSTVVPSIAGKVIDPERGELQIIFRMTLDTVSQAILTRFQLNKGAVILEYQYLPERFATGKNFSIEAPPKPPQRYFTDTGTELPYDWVLVYRSNFGWVWEPKIAPGIGGDWFTELVPDGWLEIDGLIHTQATFPRLFTALGTRYGTHYTTAAVLADLVTVTNKANGVVTDAAAVSSGFVVTVTQQGTAGLPEIFTVQTTDGATVAPGTYFTFSIPGRDFAPWFTVDNIGNAPSVPGATLLHIPLLSIDDSNDVAAKVRAILNPAGFTIPDGRGTYWRGWDHGRGFDPDAATRTDRGDGTTGDNPGTQQLDEFKSHSHLVVVDDVNSPGTRVPTPVGTHITNLGTSNYEPPPLVIPGNMAADMIANSGGAETRTKNTYVMRIIKY